MDIEALSENLLRMLHKAVRDAFDEDERLPANAKKYGVRQFLDWKATGDALEAELARRQLAFDPVPWTQPRSAARVMHYGAGVTPVPGEVYVIQHSSRGEFFVERLPASGGPAVQIGGPFETADAAQVAAALH